MWNSNKYNKLVTITRKLQTHRYREQTSGYGSGRQALQNREWEAETAGCDTGWQILKTLKTLRVSGH